MQRESASRPVDFGVGLGFGDAAQRNEAAASSKNVFLDESLLSKFATLIPQQHINPKKRVRNRRRRTFHRLKEVPEKPKSRLLDQEA
jgi:hypothetical protein